MQATTARVMMHSSELKETQRRLVVAEEEAQQLKATIDSTRGKYSRKLLLTYLNLGFILKSLCLYFLSL